MADNEKGVVILREQNRITVSMKRSEACAKCRACVAGLGEREMRLVAKNECGADVGDIVRIELREGVFIRAALILYGIPLVFMMCGFLLGKLLSGVFVYINSEILSFMLGVLALVSSYLLIHMRQHKLKLYNYEPAAVEIIRALHGGGGDV